MSYVSYLTSKRNTMFTKITSPLIAFALAFFMSFMPANAQGWLQHDYGLWQTIEGGSRGFVDVAQTADGGYVMIANYDQWLMPDGTELVRTNHLGEKLWLTEFNYGAADEEATAANAISLTPDGEMVLVGTVNNPTFGTIDLLIIKADAAGNELWHQNYTDGGLGSFWYGNDVAISNNGDITVVGERGVGDFVAPVPTPYASRHDENGMLLWESNFLTNYNYGKFTSVVELSDGNTVAAGHYNNDGTGQIELLAIKFDPSGNILWESAYDVDTFDAYLFAQVIESDNGNIILGTHTRYNGLGPTDQVENCQPFLMEIDAATGALIWHNTYDTFSNTATFSVAQSPDGGYALCGFNETGNPFMIKADATGNLLWDNVLIDDWSGYARKMIATNDGGYAFVGKGTQPGTSWQQHFLLKTDGLGNSLTNIISGKVFDDFDGDCEYDAGETVYADRLVEITPGPFYALTDANGDYAVTVGTGNFTVTAHPPIDYLWAQTCPADAYEVEFLDSYETSENNNFGQTIDVFCPVMNVTIGTPLLRRCFDNTYHVNYCNEGTDVALNAYVEVTFDNDIIITSADLPWDTPVVDNTYVFQLGDVPAGFCDEFGIDFTVNCDAVLNSTACSQAHIYPDEDCREPDPTWDLSSVEVSSSCNEDGEVVFTLRNVGMGDMSLASNYRLYEDDLLLSVNTFQLNAGGEIEVTTPANGGFIRLEADQCPGHPGFSNPTAFVEACGATGSDASLGFVNDYPMDDEDAFVDVDCRTIIGSYDPNDKLVFPEGLTEVHYVKPGVPLEYTIRFQNTGNDTAFTVVVVDTLSQYLNVPSIELGAASHSHEFDITESGVLRWTFNNILLPDSNVNEAASHGFVKFKIRQQPDLAPETRIENNAHIYFDFNDAIVTPMAYSTILDTTFVFVAPKVKNDFDVRLHPNPTQGLVHFEWSSQQPDLANAGMKLEVYDLVGRRVKNRRH